MKIPFHKFISDRESHSNVSDVLDGENINQVQKLQEEFCEYIGCKYAHATSHGSSAIHLAMLALELKRGDKVVCSVNAHPSIPESVRHFDAEPVFIDIDEDSYNINLDLLEEYLKENKSKKLKAVVVTHIAGVSVDLDRLYTMGKTYNVKIVEDASDALGATFNGQKIGSTGADLVCFNFSPHMKNNICNGGMLVSDDEDLMAKARLLSNHAIVKNENALEYIYDVVDIGNDYSMSELEAAYIRAQLKQQDEFIAKQKEIAKLYNEKLQNVENLEIPKELNSEMPYSLYIVRVHKNRDSFAAKLQEEGVYTALHYIPLHLLTYYKTKYNLRVNDFPVALRTYQQTLSLPIYPTMTQKEVEFVAKTIQKVLTSRG